MGDQLEQINILVADTLSEKDIYVKSVREEVETRDLSEEKIKNALGLKVKIPRFCGYDSDLDIYTFREQFEKFVTPYVQKPLLPDTLKMNYLGDPALTLLKELKNMDEIWDQLFKSYGNMQVCSCLTSLGISQKLVASMKLRATRTSCMASPV